MQKKRGSKEVQEAIRLKVCAYLKNNLGTQKQAAEIFELSIRSVNRIWCNYKIKGSWGFTKQKTGCTRR